MVTNPETKHYEAKIIFLRSIQTFKLLVEDLLFTACKQQNTGRDAMNKEEFKVSKQDD